MKVKNLFENNNQINNEKCARCKKEMKQAYWIHPSHKPILVCTKCRDDYEKLKNSNKKDNKK